MPHDTCPPPPRPAPRRRLHLTLDVHADTMTALDTALADITHSLALAASRGQESTGVTSGADGPSYRYHLTCNLDGDTPTPQGGTCG